MTHRPIPVNHDHHAHILLYVCTNISLGAHGRENEEKLPREQEVHRLEKVVLALLHLFGIDHLD